MTISLEMAADFQAMLASLTPQEVKRLLENSIIANNASTLHVEKRVILEDADLGGETMLSLTMYFK
jgi:hypothetical protein